MVARDGGVAGHRRFRRPAHLGSRCPRAASREDEKEDNPAEFTVWIDEHHVRQIETDVFFSRNRSLGTKILELWDFGVPVGSLDWTSVFNIQYSVYMLFMVLVGGMGTIEGPVLGALVLFGLQEALSSQGAWYLVMVGGLAVIATLVASRGLWGLASDRFGWSLLPVGYRVRSPRR